MFYGQSLLYTYSLPYLRILLPTIPPICEAMRRGGKIYSVDEEEGKLQCGFILQIALFSSMANKNAFYDPRRESEMMICEHFFEQPSTVAPWIILWRWLGLFEHTQGKFFCSKINCRVFSFTYFCIYVDKKDICKKGYLYAHSWIYDKGNLLLLYRK